MEFIEISAKTVADAVTLACQQLAITSEKLEYEVVDEGKAGILGFGAKPAIIKARVKATLVDNVKIFLNEVFAAMNIYEKEYAQKMYGKIYFMRVSQNGKTSYCFETASRGFFSWIEKGFRDVKENTVENHMYVIPKS